MFGKPRLIDKHTTAWIVDRFAWILETFGPDKPVNETELALPTPAFFPVSGDSDNHRVDILRRVAALAGVEAWPLALYPYEENAAKPVGEALLLQPLTQPGPVESNDNAADPQAYPIGYPEHYATRPQHLVACFAWAISHHLCAGKPLPEEFEEDEIGALNDLISVYLGFGVFRCNTTFDSASDSDGRSHSWSIERQGYLTEASMLFATALFIRLNGTAPEIAREHIKPRLHKQFDKAVRQVDAFPDDLAYLRSLEPPKLTVVE